MHYLATLLSKLSQQVQLPSHRLKLHQNGPLIKPCSKFYSSLNFQNIRRSFPIASESTIQPPWFQNDFKQQFQLQKHRFKLNQNVPLRVPAFKFFSAVPTSETSVQITSESTVQSPCFNSFLNSANFSNIDSNCIRRHHYAFLLSKFSQQFQLPKHCFNLCPKKLISVLVFKIVSALPNAQTIVSNTVKMR